MNMTLKNTGFSFFFKDVLSHVTRHITHVSHIIIKLNTRKLRIVAIDMIYINVLNKKL